METWLNLTAAGSSSITGNHYGGNRQEVNYECDVWQRNCWCYSLVPVDEAQWGGVDVLTAVVARSSRSSLRSVRFYSHIVRRQPNVVEEHITSLSWSKTKPIHKLTHSRHKFFGFVFDTEDVWPWRRTWGCACQQSELGQWPSWDIAKNRFIHLHL